MRERRPTEYRATPDFQIASKDILAILQTDLNGHNVRRAKAARQLYEFLSLLLAHDQKMEARADSRGAEVLKLKGALEFVSRKVTVAPEKHEAVQGEAQKVGQ